MNLLEKRKQTADQILEGRYIKRVLGQASKDINEAQNKKMTSFKSSFWNRRQFNVSESSLELLHPKAERFVDMKKRNTKTKGQIKKKSHPIHNKIIWGHYNNIVKELAYGYTNAVKEELRSIQDLKK